MLIYVTKCPQCGNDHKIPTKIVALLDYVNIPLVCPTTNRKIEAYVTVEVTKED